MGLLDQIGYGVPEAAYGTAQTPTRFVPFVSETLTREKLTIEPEGLQGAGRELRVGARRKVVGRNAGGQVRHELGPDDIGFLFLHALGAVATSTPAGGTDAREHVFTLGSLLGKSFTTQKGIEGDGGTVTPYNLLGCKIRSLTLSAARDQYVMLSVDIDAQDVQGASTLALEPVVVTDGNLFAFDGCTLSAAAGADLAMAHAFEVTITNQLTSREQTLYFGQSGLKGEPRDEGYPTVTGSITLRYDDASQVETAVDQDTPLAITFDALTGAEVEAGQDEQLTVDLGDVRLGDATPQSGGAQIPDVQVPFTCYKPAGDSISVLLRNGDATP